jgi:hypothetical protein
LQPFQLFKLFNPSLHPFDGLRAGSPRGGTLSQCHPEAVAEGSPICKALQSLDFSPAAQNDIRVIFALRHSLGAGKKEFRCELWVLTIGLIGLN